MLGSYFTTLYSKGQEIFLRNKLAQLIETEAGIWYIYSPMYRGVEGTPIPRTFPRVTPETLIRLRGEYDASPTDFILDTQKMMKRKGDINLYDLLDEPISKPSAFAKRRKLTSESKPTVTDDVIRASLITWRALDAAEPTLPKVLPDEEWYADPPSPDLYMRENPALLSWIKAVSQTPGRGKYIREGAMKVYAKKRKAFYQEGNRRET